MSTPDWNVWGPAPQESDWADERAREIAAVAPKGTREEAESMIAAALRAEREKLISAEVSIGALKISRAAERERGQKLAKAATVLTTWMKDPAIALWNRNGLEHLCDGAIALEEALAAWQEART